MPLWPLLLYLLAATALAIGALRFRSGMLRRDAAVLIFAPLVFVGPALVSGDTLSPINRAYRVQPLDAHRELLLDRAPSAAILHDPFTMILPWRAAVRHAFTLGEWPLWNPWSRAGEPLAGLAQSAPYAPVNLLALAVPIEDEAALTGGLNLAIAGLGGFLALAAFGLSRRACLLGAVAWSSSGFLLFWLLWPVTPTLAFFPWVLWAAVRLAREPRLGNAALLTLALTLILLTGHSESVAHAVLVSAFCAAFVVPWRQARTALRAILLALAAGVVAATLSAFFLLPPLDAIDQTIELARRRGAPDRAFQARPLGSAMALLRAEFVPFAWGITNEEVGKNPRYGMTLYAPDRAFSGGLILALAVAGLGVGLAGPRRRLAAAGGALYLFGLLAGIGFRPLHELLKRLPIFDLALNNRLAFVGAFGLALLAAAAIDAWDSRPPLAPFRLPTLPGLPAVSLLTTGAAAALALLALLFWRDASALGLDGTTYLARTAWLVVPALGGAVFLAAARPRDLILLLVLAAHLAERRVESDYLFRPQARNAFFPRVAPLDAIPDPPEPQRMAALDFALPANMATHYGLEDLRGGNAMTLRRLAELKSAWRANGRSSSTLVQVSRADDPALNLLNVRYVLAARQRGVPSWYRPIAQGSSLALYENRRALPRAFLPRRVVFGSDPATLLSRAAAIGNYRRLATIEPIGRQVATHEQPNPRGRLSTRKNGLGLRIDADLAAPGWIVVSETHWRGWRATVAGRELPLAFADHAFLGIQAPAGRSRIDLTYRPRSFVWGLWISGTALVLLAGLAGAGLLRTKRLRPPAGPLSRHSRPNRVERSCATGSASPAGGLPFELPLTGLCRSPGAD